MIARARAAVMTAPGSIELRTLDVPEPEPGAAVLRMRMSGICGTDKHTFRGETLQYPGTPHERELTFPLICGHENVAEVAAIGSPGELRDWEGTPLAAGDRVVPAANVSCGRCWYCRTGKAYYLCERLEDYGNSLNAGSPPGLFGGWSEYLYLLPNSRLFRVPDELPDEVAVLTEIMAVTHGLDTARRILGEGGGESLAVVGAGPLGMCHVVKARLAGFGAIVAMDRFAERAELATAFGATTGLAASDEAEDALRELTGGRGPDVVADCSGRPETFATALRMVRPGGVVVEAGAFVGLGPTAVDPAADICTRDVKVVGVGGERADAYAPAMALMAANVDRLPLRRFVTHRFGLEDAARALSESESAGALKVVLEPRAARAAAAAGASI